jgi:hypothetical protein
MELDHSPSFSNPKVVLRSCSEKGGFGVFAGDYIQVGELIFAWGGEIVTEQQLADVPVKRSTHGLQVDDGIYLLPMMEDDMADCVNHSCNPNAGMRGQISLVAMRDIQKEEEICFDYAMTDSSDYDEFECHCGSPNCRKMITGNDWRNPELHVKYAGYFSTYLERKITSLYQQKKLSYQPPMWVTMRVATYG